MTSNDLRPGGLLVGLNLTSSVTLTVPSVNCDLITLLLNEAYRQMKQMWVDENYLTFTKFSNL
jgi:hypothetical protein